MNNAIGKNWLAILFFVGATLVWGFPVANAIERPFCESAAEIGKRHYGPFDYMNMADRKKHLPVVERHHFTYQVETLQSGQSGLIGDDLDYTLKAFPNHHKALYAMIRYKLYSPEAKRAKTDSMECYFNRALQVNSRDAYVYLLYGLYLHETKKYKAALKEYKQAEKLSKNNSELFYNIGLLYFDMKEYDNALKYAKLAYKLKYPLQGLKNQLKEVHKWK